MAAQPPKGAVPEKHGADVKESEPTSESDTLEAGATEAPEAAETEKEKVSLDEADLESLSESKKIPYQRFKQVNEKSKSLEKQLDEMKSQYQSDLRREIDNAELRLSAKHQNQTSESEDIYLDDGTKQVSELAQQVEALKEQLTGLKTQNSEQSLNSKIRELEVTYPEADRLSVLGWAKSKPGVDIEELMELSHNRNVERVEKTVRNLLEQKKKRQSQAFPSKSGGGSLLKPGERPKTVADAHKAVRKLNWSQLFK